MNFDEAALIVIWETTQAFDLLAYTIVHLLSQLATKVN